MFLKDQRVGKYRIEKPLGNGGFGSVFLAEDTVIGKMVAVKVPHKQNQSREAMAAEARLMAPLSHPNIVSVLTADMDEESNVFYIVMEYVEGESLAEKLTREGSPRGAPGPCMVHSDHRRSPLRPFPQHPAPRSPAQQRTPDDRRPGQGGRFLDIPTSRAGPVCINPHRVPSVHGARALSGPGDIRIGHLFHRCHDVRDGHGRTPLLRYQSLERSRNSWPADDSPRPCSRTERSAKHSAISSSDACSGTSPSDIGTPKPSWKT